MLVDDAQGNDYCYYDNKHYIDTMQVYWKKTGFYYHKAFNIYFPMDEYYYPPFYSFKFLKKLNIDTKHEYT